MWKSTLDLPRVMCNGVTHTGMEIIRSDTYDTKKI